MIPSLSEIFDFMCCAEAASVSLSLYYSNVQMDSLKVTYRDGKIFYCLQNVPSVPHSVLMTGEIMFSF